MNRLALIACFVAGSASAQIPDFTSTPINFPGNASSQAVDPSGNIWITDPTNGVIGKIELPSQTYTAYPVPASEQNAKPYSIAVTPDGAVWYTDYNNPIIGRLSVDGNFTLFPVASTTFYIAASADGGVFFSYFTLSKLGYLSLLSGLHSFDFPLPAGAFVEDLTVGPDGAAYFTDLHSNHRIVRMGLDGSVNTFLDSVANPPISLTWFPSIATGPDGNMWFTHATAIGRLRLSDGVITEFPIPYAMADAGGICAGADGNVWYADSLAGAGVLGQLVVSTATDDGHATINASPGIGEPIGIIALPPGAGQAAALNSQSLAEDTPPPPCSGAAFSIEDNAFSGANLKYAVIFSGGIVHPCADLRVEPVSVEIKFALGEYIEFKFQVFNGGPDAADSPFLDMINVLGVSQIAPPNQADWNCIVPSSIHPVMTCIRKAPLPAGSRDVFTVNVFPELAAPNVEFNTFVYSYTKDPLLLNNIFNVGLLASQRGKVTVKGIKSNFVRPVPGRP